MHGHARSAEIMHAKQHPPRPIDREGAWPHNNTLARHTGPRTNTGTARRTHKRPRAKARRAHAQTDERPNATHHATAAASHETTPLRG